MQGMDESLLVVLAWFVRRSDAGSLRMEDLWACCQADALFVIGKHGFGFRVGIARLLVSHQRGMPTSYHEKPGPDQ